MVRSIGIQARECCLREKDRLKAELQACDDESSSPEERHLCYRWAAKKSGRRSKECLIA